MSASKHRLYFLLQTAAHRLKKKADAALVLAGSMTTAQAAAMLVIASEGPVSQRRIAGVLTLGESAITPMAARLVKAGYAVRERSASDNRVWQLSATEQGLNALTEIQASFDQVNDLIDGQLDDVEAANMAAALKNVINALESEEKKAAKF